MLLAFYIGLLKLLYAVILYNAALLSTLDQLHHVITRLRPDAVRCFESFYFYNTFDKHKHTYE